MKIIEFGNLFFLMLSCLVFNIVPVFFYGLVYENNRIWGFIFGYNLGICIELEKDSNILFNDVRIALSYIFYNHLLRYATCDKPVFIIFFFFMYFIILSGS